MNRRPETRPREPQPVAPLNNVFHPTQPDTETVNVELLVFTPPFDASDGLDGGPQLGVPIIFHWLEPIGPETPDEILHGNVLLPFGGKPPVYPG
jgi:hypothetical protein